MVLVFAVLAGVLGLSLAAVVAVLWVWSAPEVEEDERRNQT